MPKQVRNDRVKRERFEEWDYEVDRVRTRVAYDALRNGSAADCGCAYCKDWIAYRESVIPIHVHDWFRGLGIDIAKEIEVSEYESEPPTNLFMGDYLFVGKVLSGPNPYLPVVGTAGVHVARIEIFPGFSLGLSSNTQFGPPIPESFKGLPLANITFEVRTPAINTSSG